MKLIRLKKPGLEVIELNTDSINSLEIFFDSEYNEYQLRVHLQYIIHVVHAGSFDECHMKLNQIHSALDNEIVDI